MADNNQEKPEERKEEKQPTSLESIISETSQAGKGLVNSSIGLGAIAGATALFGLDGLLIASLSPYSGRIISKLAGKEFTSKNFRDEAIAGLLMTPVIKYLFTAVQNIPKAFGLEGLVNVLGVSMPYYALAAGGLALAIFPLFNAISYSIKYLVNNKTFKGIGQYFKENYWKDTKKSLLYLGLPAAATIAIATAIPLGLYLLPVFLGLGVSYRAIFSKEKLNYAKLLNPFTYIPNFINPFYLASGTASAAGKLYSSATTALYDLGAAVREFFKKTPVPEPKPA